MNLHTYRPELFQQEAILTEATALERLRRDPLPEAVNYFAAPWSVMINSDDFQVNDVYLAGGFTICQHIRYREIIPICLRIGIDTLFTPHVERHDPPPGGRLLHWAGRIAGLRSLIRDRLEAARNFRVLPFPHLAVNGAAPAAEKDLHYSFVGFNTHPTREIIFALPARDDAVVIRRERWHFDSSPEQQEADKREYQELLARSRFSLCPRGTGASTVRFWESLQAGAIPILITDAMLLPDGFDWDRCVVRIAERNTPRLLEKLDSITKQQESILRSNCLKAYQQFSGEQFVSSVRRCYPDRKMAA